MRRAGLMFLLLLCCSFAAMAASTLTMGFGANSACATAGTGCLTHPNLNFWAGQYHLSSSFSVFQTSGGANVALTSPLLLVLGVANQNSPTLFSGTSINGVQAYNPYVPVANAPTSGTWTYGSSHFGLSGYVGYWTPSSPQTDVYSYLAAQAGSTVNAQNASNSQNFTNWNGSLAGLGAGVPSGYGIYTFQINAPLGPQGLVDISFLNTLTVPSKTYLVGYGLAGNSVMSTPFTKTALQFPEPASWILLSTAGIGVVLVRRLRRRGTQPSTVA